MKNPSLKSRIAIRLFVALSTLGILILTLLLGYTVQAQPMRILFMHHSTGHNLIEQGDVRQGLTALGYEFYDHGYNEEGLRLADGSWTGTNFDVPGDNTDPDGYAEIFAQPHHDPLDNTFSHMMQYDAIAFKSCFPTSNIGDDELLAQYQSYYLSIRDRMDQYPDKLFIIVTQPPELPNNSDPEAAARARTFVNWLQSDEYLAGRPNIVVFDFFDLLAGEDNFLRSEYRLDQYDAHPNERANRDIGPVFVAFIDQAIQSFEGGAPRPTALPTQDVPAVTEAPADPEVAVEPPPAAPPLKTTGLIDDFEIAEVYLDTNIDEMGSTLDCSLDPEKAHKGGSALRLQYDIVQDGWGVCGRSFDPVQDWSSAAALSMWLSSEQTGQWVTLGLFAGSPEDPIPYETNFEITATDWTLYTFQWDDFEKAPWAAESGPPEVDPAQVIGYAFSIGAQDGQIENTFWVDDISLGAGEEQLQTEGEAVEQESISEAPSVEGEAEEAVEEQSSGSVCPFSMLAIPIGVGLVLLVRRRR